MTSVCLSRLRKEFIELKKKPIDNIRAAPKETNTLEWHYVIEGAKGSVYEGGWYHGIVTFPKEYPHKPPSIQMNTPNGRFKTHTRLCLSMSDFHPESWNPLWSVGTILLGLYTFMLDSQPTHGSIVTSDAERRKLAAESLEYNVKNNKTFCELFPELVEQFEEKKKEQAEVVGTNVGVEAVGGSVSSSSVEGLAVDEHKANTSWLTMVGILAAVVAFTWAILNISV